MEVKGASAANVDYRSITILSFRNRFPQPQRHAAWEISGGLLVDFQRRTQSEPYLVVLLSLAISPCACSSAFALLVCVFPRWVTAVCALKMTSIEAASPNLLLHQDTTSAGNALAPLLLCLSLPLLHGDSLRPKPRPLTSRSRLPGTASSAHTTL